jgi:DNA-binding XRE family transcriptional regulator
LFSLPATESPQVDLARDDSAQARMDAQLSQRQQAVLIGLSEKNAVFFEQEMEKLEGWAGDIKESLEHELKDLDREIKDTKREAQLAASLESKVALHKRIKELELRRAEKRRGLFEAQDAVDTRKDLLLTEIESRLKQGIEEKALFSIRWKVE